MSLVGFKASNHPQQTRYRGSNDRALPSDDFAKLQAEFAFTIDVAASDQNAKLPRYYTKEQDGLFQSWAGERVYCNCPYSSIEPWAEKAWQEMEAELIVMLLPANRTEQDWWQRKIEPFRDRPETPLRVRFLPGRYRFLKPGQTSIMPNERPQSGYCLCIWQHNGWTRPVDEPRLFT